MHHKQKAEGHAQQKCQNCVCYGEQTCYKHACIHTAPHKSMQYLIHVEMLKQKQDSMYSKTIPHNKLNLYNQKKLTSKPKCYKYYKVTEK